MNKKVMLIISISIIITLFIIITISIKNSSFITTISDTSGKLEESNGSQEITNNTNTSFTSWEELSNSIKTTDSPNTYNESIINLITLEIDNESITNTSATLTITDNNNPPCSWDREYSIQKNTNGEWQELEPIKDIIIDTLAYKYKLDENNQCTIKIDWKDNYGELQKGIYRIAKKIGELDNTYVYSNEFEIK